METAILKCLTKNRDERWASVAELAKALVPFGSGTWTHAADEIRKTLTRPLADDTNPSRSRPGSGAVISSRRFDSDVQPTASTVIGKRKFQLSGDGSRWPMMITIAVVLSAALFATAVWIRRGHAAAQPGPDIDPEALPAQIVPVPQVPTQVPNGVQAPGQVPGVQQGVTQMGQPGLVATSGGLVQTGAPAFELDDAGVHAQSATAPPRAVAPQPGLAPVGAPAKKWRPAPSQPSPSPRQQPVPAKTSAGLPSELDGQK
jgi:hypothetical protein